MAPLAALPLPWVSTHLQGPSQDTDPPLPLHFPRQQDELLKLCFQGSGNPGIHTAIEDIISPFRLLAGKARDEWLQDNVCCIQS